VSDLVTIKETASILACSTMTVRRLIKDGKLGDITRNGRKYVRISRASVNSFISKHTEEAVK